MVQTVEPTPTVVQPSAQEVHVFESLDVEKVPGGHGIATAEPAGQKLPGTAVHVIPQDTDTVEAPGYITISWGETPSTYDPATHGRQTGMRVHCKTLYRLLFGEVCSVSQFLWVSSPGEYLSVVQ